MNPDRPIYSSASHDTSSVRPRNRRLISYGDENDSVLHDAGPSNSWSRSNSQSPFPSRGVSPIPGTHPSRQPSSTTKAGSITSSDGSAWRRNDNEQSNASSGLGLWESWSSLQGIASTLLGSNAQQSTKLKSGDALGSAVWRKPGKGLNTGPPNPQWGPDIAAGQKYSTGSKEERQAMVQAKKRETLLLADETQFCPSSASHKRRDSNLRLSNSATTTDQDGDAFVYVHQVRPQDTLAGVMIRYQCQPAVFRKVNRLWPNDNIQIREHVFLPVEACSVKGRKVDAAIDSTLNHDISNSSVPQQAHHNSNNLFSLDTNNSSPSLTSNQNPDLDPEYKHEYFVSIPGIPESIEIARIPRRTLGFFPPSRRKSQTLSDPDFSYSDSPKTSFDITSSRLNPLSLNTSPSPSRNRARPPNRPHRSNSASYWADRLKGPGGVGTLRGSGPGWPANPGPAEDSLNKMFAHHLPNVAPRDSFDSVHSATSSTGTGLENVGGVIEGWVRKVGTRIAGGLEPAEAYRRQMGGRMGDLIELESSGEGGILDGSALPSQVDGSGARRGSGDFSINTNPGTAATVTATEEEVLLRERFPPRGRMVDAQTSRRL
jgi:hypothetical protein